jgi:hypothetical protein
MILRVYALYGGNAIVLVVPGVIIVAEIIIMGLPLYLLSRTSKSPLSRHVVADDQQQRQAMVDVWFSWTASVCPVIAYRWQNN